MATKFTSKEFKKSLYQAAGGSHIRKGEMMKAMKKVGAGKPLYGSVSKERALKTLKQMKAKGILSGFQQRQAKNSLLRQVKEVQKPKGPSPEELRRQEALRRRNIYEAQRTRQEELKKEGTASVQSKASSTPQAVPLAGGRIESATPSGPSQTGNLNNSYQSQPERGPETPETGAERNLGGQVEDNPPSPDTAEDLPIE